MEKESCIFVLLGPSGSGKSALGELIKTHGGEQIISHTTRPKRKGEIEGVHYYFVEKEEFNQIEMFERSRHSGNLYGVSIKEIEFKLNHYEVVFAILEIEGVKIFKEIFGNRVKVIFVETDTNLLAKRMRERGDSEESIHQRLAYLESHQEQTNKKYADYVVQNNQTLEDAWRSLEKIINIEKMSKLEKTKK